MHFEAAVKAGQARLHGKAGRRRRRRRAQGARRGRGGEEEEPEGRRRPAAPPPARRTIETIKRVQDGAIGDIDRCSASTGTAPASWVRAAQDRARPRWSTRCATGTTSTGSAATTSSSSTSTTSTSSTGSRTATRCKAQGHGRPAGRTRQGLRRDLRPSLRRVHLRRRHDDAQPVPPPAQLLEQRLASTRTAPRATPTSAAAASRRPTDGEAWRYKGAGRRRTRTRVSTTTSSTPSATTSPTTRPSTARTAR